MFSATPAGIVEPSLRFKDSHAPGFDAAGEVSQCRCDAIVSSLQIWESFEVFEALRTGKTKQPSADMARCQTSEEET